MAEIASINGKTLTVIGSFNVAMTGVDSINGVDNASGSTIVIDFDGSTTYITNNSTEQDGWRNVVISGMQTGDVITINYTMELTVEGVMPGEAEGYVRENLGSWQLEASTIGFLSSPETHANINTTDNIDLRVRAYVDDLGDFAEAKVTLTGGSVTTGSGTVTASGTTSFTVTAGAIPP